MRVKVSSGAWTGADIDTYIEYKFFTRFLMDLKELILNPGLSACLRTDKMTSSVDIENLDGEFLFIRFVSSATLPEVWIYGHVQQV